MTAASWAILRPSSRPTPSTTTTLRLHRSHPALPMPLTPHPPPAASHLSSPIPRLPLKSHAMDMPPIYPPPSVHTDVAAAAAADAAGLDIPEGGAMSLSPLAIMPALSSQSDHHDSCSAAAASQGQGPGGGDQKATGPPKAGEVGGQRLGRAPALVQSAPPGSTGGGDHGSGHWRR